jgi:hypothetical protein
MSHENQSRAWVLGKEKGEERKRIKKKRKEKKNE